MVKSHKYALVLLHLNFKLFFEAFLLRHDLLVDNLQNVFELTVQLILNSDNLLVSVPDSLS